MRLLIIYTNLPIGGIETFIVRLAAALKKKSIQVDVLFFSNKFDDNLLQQLKCDATIHYWDDYVYFPHFSKSLKPFMKLLVPIKIRKLRLLFKSVTHIHAPDMLSILFYSRLNKIFKEVSISSGIYHINEFLVSSFKKHYFARLIYNFIAKLPVNNMLFFNEICFEEYNKQFNQNFNEKLISPIGVDIKNDNLNNNIAGIQNNRIVSIGRLAKWKTYNFHIIEVINELKQRGIELTYDSYGDGELRLDLEKRVKEKNLENNIKFHGGIPYANFNNIISKSFVFIGAGTALIEASSLGLPAVIGIENENEPLTYGLLSDTNTYSYQENSLKLPRKKITDIILELLSMTKEEYELVCEKAKIRALDFDMNITTDKFIFLMTESEKLNYKLNYLKICLFVLSLQFHKFKCKLSKSDISYFNRL